MISFLYSGLVAPTWHQRLAVPGDPNLVTARQTLHATYALVTYSPQESPLISAQVTEVTRKFRSAMSSSDQQHQLVTSVNVPNDIIEIPGATI